MPDFVKIINKNDKPFDFHQNNRKRVLQPGEDAIIPWGLACSLFGHPSTLNVHPRNERDKLYQKVRSRFNYTLGMVPPEAHEQGIRNPEDWWEVIRPRIDVYDIENNERVWMVIDDPTGEHMSQPPKSVSGSADIAMLMQQIQVLTNQVHKLTQQQQAQPGPSSAGTQSPVPTADGPLPTADQGGFDIPIVHPQPTPDEDSDAAPSLDLASLAAQVAAQAGQSGGQGAPVRDASADSPQAVPSGDIPSKMPPRPGN